MTQKQQVANLSAPKPNLETGLQLTAVRDHLAQAGFMPNRVAIISMFHMPALGHIVL